MLKPPAHDDDPERKGEAAYAFPTKSRCPRGQGGCGSVRTVAYSTQGRMQHRKCLDCGQTYKVMGWKI